MRKLNFWWFYKLKTLYKNVPIVFSTECFITLLIFWVYIYKRDFIIEKQLPRWIIKKQPILFIPSFLLCNSNDKPFFYSRMLANHDKVDRLWAKMVKSL